MGQEGVGEAAAANAKVTRLLLFVLVDGSTCWIPTVQRSHYYS